MCSKIIVFIRSVLFSISSLFASIPMSIAFILFWLPFFPNRRKTFDYCAAYWCYFILFSLRITTGIKWNIKGFEKLQKNKSYIIISKHESTWDTLIMHTLMRPTPVFILKKELLWVPFFGWCLALSSKIAIDRKGGINSLKKVIKEGKKFIKENRNIIIFPQGTRVPLNSKVEDYPYKPGFVALVKELGVDIVPVALNSGKFWKKKQFIKASGTIEMEFMDPIPFETIKNMNKEEMIKMLSNIIEPKSIELANLNDDKKI